MAYDYDKRTLVKRADDASHTSYEEALAKIRMTFVGAVGEAVYDYITTLHKRIGSRPPWEDITGFKSWDYGSPRPSGRNGYRIRVWQKDAAQYPGGLDPNIEIDVLFVGLTLIVSATGRNLTLLSEKRPLDVTPSTLGLRIGEAWEKLLTGSVDYGD